MPASRSRHIKSSAFDPVILVDVQDALLSDDTVGAIQHLARSVLEGPVEQTESRLADLCASLEQDPELALSLGRALRGLLVDLRVGPALIESSMMSSFSFLQELGARTIRRFLAELYDDDDLRTAIRHIFPGRDDHLRVAAVSDTALKRLLTVLGILDDGDTSLDPEVAVSIRTLTSHAASFGLQPEYTERFSPDPDADSPFLDLPTRVLDYLTSATNSPPDGDVELLEEALRTVERCREQVRGVRTSMNVQGSSLALTRITFRLLRILDRLELLLRFTDRTADNFHAGVVRLFQEIVTAEKTHNHILPHVRAHVDLLAYQVVEHAARKGGKYITSGRRDYAGFFLASLGGGGIVAVFSFLKITLGKLDAPLGVEAILYGLNYSACFVLIYLTGAALATKQPAMTANTIAQALGRRQDRHLEQLETLVVRVWRSQFVSFAGNLFMALPVAFVLSEVFFRSSGDTVTSEAYATSMMEALHPWQSGTIVFAAIAGVFLFISGLISGWVDNRFTYAHVPERIARQHLLVRLLGADRARSTADFLYRNLGAVAGNVFLGFALGSTGTLGEIFGLPLDIRHIAFASAEFGTALEVLHFGVAFSLVWPVALGVALIGLVNFVVSFGLSFAVALESRQITWGEIRLLSVHLAQSFFKRPTDWFFPPGSRDG